MMGGTRNEDDADGDQPALPVLKGVSWFRQFQCVINKNWKLLTRRPISLCFMLVSGILSVALAWVAGRDREDAIYPSLTDCGTIPKGYAQDLNLDWDEESRLQYSMNDRWRWGLPIALMALGPCFNAVLVFNILHTTEFVNQMLGVQRALGLRESVFWASWYISFAAIAFVNSILGAITAKLMPGIHAYENIYFGGIFISLWLLQLALTAASCFLAALCGTAKRGPNWLILMMLIAMWIPTLVNSGSSSWYDGGTSPSGSFWQYSDTFDRTYATTFYNDTINETHWETNWDIEETVCQRPLVSDFQGHFYKTEEQRKELRDDEYFVGCFTLASWPVDIWNPQGRKQKIGLPILSLFPYFHFAVVWGNFLGYTSMPDREFTSKETGMTPEALAAKALPIPQDPSRGLGSTLVPQGSMLEIDSYWEWDWCYEDVCEQLSTCPHENRTEGFCDYLSSCNHVVNDKPTESPTTRHGYLLLVASSVFYMVIAAYWAQIFPGGNGKPQKCLFFLSPAYWFGSDSVGEKTSSLSDEDNEDTSSRALHESTARGGGIVVDSVRKAYGSEEALKGVSITMERGEVTALLGHNGAGKTTLSHVLCCEIAPTEGDIYVFGHSVTENPCAVRRMVGLCKQDDYLWPDLTAREHLELFAGLRGVAPSDQDDIVQKWLESVDLAEVQTQYSSQFSGGMKRRLSVALATIGSAPLIILDEPTTGMDPVSRRFVWRHIDEIKDGRVILLTTHAMEEADLLADEVAILRKGELAAFGSPLSLKSDHGSALQFSLLVHKNSVANAERTILEFFKNSSDWVRVNAGEAGNVAVNIDKICSDEEIDGVPVKLLSDFVTWLESDDSPVTEYGFSNSSLEEVFMKVTGEGKESFANENSIKDKQGCCCCCFGSRNRNREDSGTEDESGVDVEPQVKLGAEELAAFQPNLRILYQTRALFFQFWTRAWTGKGSIVGYFFHGLFLATTILVGLAYANAWNPISLFTVPTISLSVLVVTVIAPVYADRADGMFYLMCSQGLMESSYILGVVIYSFSVALIYNVLVLAGMYATPIFRAPHICGEEDYDCWGKFGERQYVWEPANIYGWEDVYKGSNVELSAVRSPSGFGMVFGVAFVSALIIPGTVLASSYLPGYRLPMVFVALAAIMFSVWPVIQTLVPQSEEQFIACLNSTNPNNVCDGAFNPTNADYHFLNCVGFGVNGDQSYRSFCIPPSAGLLPQFGIFQSLSMAYMSDIRFIAEPPGYIEDKLIPAIDALGGKCKGDTCQFPYAAKLYALNLVFMLLGAMILLLMGFAGSAAVAFPGGFVLRIRETISAAAAHLRNPLTGGRHDNSHEVIDANRTNELDEVGQEREVVHEMMRPFTTFGPGDASEDQPILNHGAIPRSHMPPVIAHKLRKVYPGLGGRPPKIALNCLDLHVPRGQVLGFLGKNGAGKTTALKILSGAHEPSGGVGLVAGYDCVLERHTIFQSLGNCAQFDVVWRGQTVQHHLEFFTRLKGLPSSLVRSTARSIAIAVGLGAPSVYTRQAGNLSGGMRRRLSIAMSLIGSPSVLILDEPTTGLDPSTRNQIWKLINAFAKADRSTIITTHMMIEADTLCNRIAIISQGNLKVVGTQQHLKNKFGSGYLLQLNLVKSSAHAQECAMEFVKRRLHPNATLGIRQAKTLHIHLPRDENLDLQRVFSALYSPECATEGCVNQFLLSQSSLEDVFVELGD